MVTTIDALLSVRDDVIARILALTPNRMVISAASFAHHQNESTPITEVTGRARLFDVVGLQQGADYGFAYTERPVMCSFQIVILYPRRTIWKAAALDDIHQIDDDLLRNAPSILGVSNRFLSRDPVQITNHPTEDWDHYSVTLEVYLSVTAA
jgi:hypothetical protein